MRTTNSLNDVSEVQKRDTSSKRDNELEQSIVRILIGIALVVYLWHHSKLSINSTLQIPDEFIVVIILFLTLAVGITICIVIKPGEVPVRRLAAIFLDVGSLTYLFIKAENDAAPLYFIYLWIIIGYGFRFGKKYLLIALAASLLSFGAVIYYVPFWAIHMNLSVGLWVGILLLSLYQSTLVGRLYKALDHAEVANRAKRQFISSVSHELRTPLNAIIGMVDLLKSTPVDREQQDMLDCMSTTSQVMLSQIEDVLDFSKIEAGKMAIEETDFDLYKLVFGIVDIFKFHVDSVAVEILTSIACDVPYALRGDPHHLRQILVNLLGNAVKFTEQGRITIRIRKLENLDSSVRLRFSIKDTGVGIAYEAQSRIFESFTQADDSTARRYGGTGLGTTICQQLVELMQGRIGFYSEPGIGSEFWFELELSLPIQPQNNYEKSKSQVIRSMIISLDEQSRPKILNLIDQINEKIQLIENFDAGISWIEQSFLSGKPIRLILFTYSPSQCIGLTEYAERLRNYVIAMKTAASHAPLSLILMMPNGLNEEAADEIAESAGFTSLLHIPADQINLQNIVHAHTVMLDNSITRKNVPVPIQDSSALAAISLKQRAEFIPYHILVAEDNPTNRKVLQKILERAGYRCSLAKNGEEALDLIEKKEFDAIVLDMNMPVMTGLEVARTYRIMHGPFARAPMIMFSANVTLDAKQSSLNAGVDEFLSKPIQIESFLKTLDRLITQYKSFGAPNQNGQNILPKRRLKWVHADESNLNIQTLEDLEKISRDPYFLDDLICEFISENKKSIARFENSLITLKYEQIKEILHSLKGSAVSVGAKSLLMICRQIEKMNETELEIHTEEILQIIKQSCFALCEELEEYRQSRNGFLVEKFD